MNPALILGAAALILLSSSKKTSRSESPGDSPDAEPKKRSGSFASRGSSSDKAKKPMYAWSTAAMNLAKMAAFAEAKKIESREPSNENILLLARGVAMRMYPTSTATKNDSWPKTMSAAMQLASKEGDQATAWKNIWDICTEELKALRPRN